MIRKGNDVSISRSRKYLVGAAVFAAVLTGVSIVPAFGLSGGEEEATIPASSTVKVVTAYGTCTGTVAEMSWVATAASCFTRNPADHPSLTDGKPELSAKVLLGEDASWRENPGIPITDLRRYPGDTRDLVLARLQNPALGVTPQRVGTTAPQAGDQLEFTGYGRTSSEWVPKQPHTATFTIDSVDTGEVFVKGTGDSTLCLGDSGAPAVRSTNQGAELVALNSRSWQHNCIGIAGQTNEGAFATRLDDAAAWIAGVTSEIQAIPSFQDQQGIAFTNVGSTSQTFTWQLVQAAPNTFLLKDPATGRCLTSPGASVNAELVSQSCDTAQTSQRFHFLTLATTDTVVIRSASTGLLVQAPGQPGGAPVQVATTDDATVKWTAKPVMLTERIYGATRYETAAAVSKATFAGTAPVVYIANGGGYVDAISAASAAAKAGGPLLLTQASALPVETRAELVRLQPSRVVFVGGTGVIPESIVTAVKSALPAATTARASGIDRYETSRETIRSAFPAAEHVYIVDSLDWATALVAGNEAIHRGAPVIAVRGSLTALDSATAAQIRGLAPQEVHVIGDTGKVSSGLYTSLTGLAPKIDRLTGTDKYDLVNRSALRAFTSASSAYLVSGADFPDALSVGVLAGKSDSPVFFSQKDCVKKATVDAISSLGVKKIVVIGGPLVLTENVVALKPCA
ncbi:cell wall-binding repeat-containing protein [uncultured Leifsonia sp.]|uniref:cell wall-binding repeat-containing protein n=1 Tax=uncultured Leifsonia sp. TaxID=340359 RepID=UPI0028D6123C|nr:cell wall-binding repeat-containing protein [uncultured Leifsonia sp.]